MKKAGGGQETVVRLSDMDVVEVSAVDVAANNRRFLVVKRRGGEADVKGKSTTKAGGEVVPDGKGGNTVTGGAGEKVALKVAPADKAALLKRFDATAKALASLRGEVEAAQEEDGAALPVELAEKASGVAGGLLGGEGVEGPVLVGKGFRQVTPARLSTLRGFHEQLGAFLSEVGSGTDSTRVESSPASGSSDAAIASLAEGLAETQKAVKEVGEKLVGVASKVTDAVKQQAGRIEALEKAKPRSNAQVADTPPKVEEKKSVAWPADLNAERRGKRV